VDGYREILRDVGTGKDADHGREEDAENSGEIPFLAVRVRVLGVPVLPK